MVGSHGLRAGRAVGLRLVVGQLVTDSGAEWLACGGPRRRLRPGAARPLGLPDGTGNDKQASYRVIMLMTSTFSQDKDFAGNRR